MATEQHRRRAAELVLRCAVITVSDTRTIATDRGGELIVEQLEAQGHQVVDRRIVPDEPEAIRQALQAAIAELGADAVLLTGGTGAAPRDRTPETVRPLLDKELPGFGELFRMLSFAEVGAAAWLSRALAGTIGRSAIFCLPGSPQAVRLALDKLILPEIRHLVSELRR